ncbi:MAG: GreA/GreB family elongation factor [Victivallales bacterium]
MAAELEELIVGALSGEENEIHQLSTKIKSSDAQELRDAQANFDSMLDTWDEAVAKSEVMARLCVELAEKDVLEGQIFRNALHNAVKFLLPPYISSQTVLKAVGARDAEVLTSEAASRLKKLQKIKSGCLVYLSDSKIWGKVASIDKGTATLGINSLAAGNLLSLPVSSALQSAVFFDANPEMFNILVPDRHRLPPAPKFKDVFNHNALTELSEARLKEIVTRLIVPDCMAIDAFQVWWNETPQTAAVRGKRAPWDARSVLELNTLLVPMEASGGVKLGIEETAKLAKLFGHLRVPMAPKDVTMLGDCIAMLSAVNPSPVLTEMFQPLRGKAPFWPAEVANARIGKELEVWGHISMKLLPAFIKASKVVYTEKELAELGCILPLRCLNLLFESLEPKIVAEAIVSRPKLSSDILLYLWKNRTKLPRNLVSIVDMNHVAEAISAEGLPKEWTTAERELKRTLFEKDGFQKFLIENADGDIPSIIDALQRVRTFQMGECQSILVKLARHSDELMAHIENEGGKRLMGAGETETSAAQPDITSQASFTKLTQELEDLITVQIPENVKAIEHARGFGDFRENAEYDAAKERRRFLHRRRAELENLVATIQTTNFKNVKINDHVVLGSTVTLADASGKTTDYYVLGALDGDPDNNRISYKTKLGEILTTTKVGDTVKLPGLGDRTVKAVSALPEAMRKELAEEA